MTNQFERAIEDYNQAIRLNPNFALAFYNRGLAYARKFQFERAIEDYNEAIRLAPKYAPAFTNRGLAKFNTRQYDRAIEDFDQAIRLDPNDASAFANRSLAKAAKGDSAGGNADIARAGQLNWTAALSGLAAAQWCLGADPDISISACTATIQSGQETQGKSGQSLPRPGHCLRGQGPT